ncbi:DUF3040 domain-containing protein [Segniliparus rugosus]|uniref:DUF3040 domain-containing protein n=1 Tax=Segniliparus rugosus (strain ATCC BAA-974 / DSM 45345 / CCUG 50838 / CIP 108380 / JCM 13579 / CDC 945) TaxID=679197 RepID=E5XMP6_SEGRC|nr:DUF3040 domain-containing protein [Segniliparus rugosus]EFV14391.1 hypothetical protein HMPREF9336_00766 [Segniliparus rugosus ATCC BAA-974]
MPLSEHEQRVLDEIESALYAEDPKFASAPWGKGLRSPSSRIGLQVAVLFVVGLVLLVLGVVVPFKFPGAFPIVSLVGFVVMFAAGIRWLWTSDSSGGAGGRVEARGGKRGQALRESRKPGLSERMEHRFRRRFEQE